MTEGVVEGKDFRKVYGISVAVDRIGFTAQKG